MMPSVQMTMDFVLSLNIPAQYGGGWYSSDEYTRCANYFRARDWSSEAVFVHPRSEM